MKRNCKLYQKIAKICDIKTLKTIPWPIENFSVTYYQLTIEAEILTINVKIKLKLQFLQENVKIRFKILKNIPLQLELMQTFLSKREEILRLLSPKKPKK